jgi:transposase-like protein
MGEKEYLYRMRLKIFEEADKNRQPITSLCKRYGVSRKWFYKWKKKREREGRESLRLKIRARPKMPNCVSGKIKNRF